MDSPKFNGEPASRIG